VVIELWAVEAVIHCLFFVAGVLSMLEMQDTGNVGSEHENVKQRVEMLRQTTG
jgi:hypothetical protein